MKLGLVIFLDLVSLWTDAMYPVVRARPAVLPDERTPTLLLADLQHRGPVLADPEACRGYREDKWISKAPLTFSVPHLISCLGFSTLARLIFTTGMQRCSKCNCKRSSFLPTIKLIIPGLIFLVCGSASYPDILFSFEFA